jgi:hypothetical protein
VAPFLSIVHLDHAMLLSTGMLLMAEMVAEAVSFHSVFLVPFFISYNFGYPFNVGRDKLI